MHWTARNTYRAFAITLLMALFFSVLHAQEKANSKLVPEAMTDETVNINERFAAKSSIEGMRNQVCWELIANLDVLLKEEDRSIMGPLHFTIDTIGNWRLEAAVPQLLPILDMQLNPATAPDFVKLTPFACYPVANALGNIGGPAVISGVLSKMHEPASELTIRCCAYVLEKTVGREVAAVIAEAELKKYGNDETSPNLKQLRDNLGMLVGVLKSDKEILSIPK